MSRIGQGVIVVGKMQVVVRENRRKKNAPRTITVREKYFLVKIILVISVGN